MKESYAEVNSIEYAAIYPDNDAAVPVTVTVHTVGAQGVTAEAVADEPSTHELLFNRIIVCVLAITLLWTTSLQMSSALAMYLVPIPPFSQVREHCAHAYHVTSQHQRSYYRCVEYQLSACKQNLYEAEAVELTRVSSLETANDLFVNHFRANVVNCSARLDTVKSVSSAWMSGGTEYVVPYLSSCSPSEKQSTMAILSDESQAKSSTVFSISSFLDTSNSRLASVASYADALMTYNAQYVANKTQSIKIDMVQVAADVSLSNIALTNVTVQNIRQSMRELEACLTLDSAVSTACPSRSIYDAYTDARDEINLRMSLVRSEIASYQADVQSYVDDVNSALVAADSFFDAINGAQGIMKWIVNNVDIVGSLCGHSSPNWCSFSKVDWLVPPLMRTTILSLIDMPDPTSLTRQVYEQVSISTSTLQSLEVQIDGNLKQFGSQLAVQLSAVDVSPKDYHPPAYSSFSSGSNASADAVSQQQESSSFLSAVETDIFNSSNGGDSSGIDVGRLVAGMSITGNWTSFSLSAAALSTFKTVWSQFHVKSLDDSLLWDSFHSVNAYCFLLDYIYRAVQTCKLITAFWSRGVVSLPLVDLRPSQRSVSSDKSVLSRLAICLRLLPFIWIQLLIIAAVILVLVWLVATVLVPEFRSYRSACVSHSQDQSFLSENLAALAINYASMDGNALVAAGISAYNARVGTVCAQHFSTSAATYTKIHEQLVSINATLTTLTGQSSLISSCVDAKHLNASIVLSCCQSLSALESKCPSGGLTCPSKLSSLLKAGTELMTSSAFATCGADSLLRESNYTLTNALGGTMYSVYQCDALPACEITCQRPPIALLSTVAKDCSCVAEWYGNASLLQLTLALLIFLLLNISRSLFVQGILQCSWTSLTPAKLSFQSECDLEGRVTGADDEKGREKLALLIRQKLFWFRCRGLLFVAGGVLLNMCWVVPMLLFTHNDLAYNPNSSR